MKRFGRALRRRWSGCCRRSRFETKTNCLRLLSRKSMSVRYWPRTYGGSMPRLRPPNCRTPGPRRHPQTRHRTRYHRHAARQLTSDGKADARPPPRHATAPRNSPRPRSDHPTGVGHVAIRSRRCRLPPAERRPGPSPSRRFRGPGTQASRGPACRRHRVRPMASGSRRAPRPARPGGRRSSPLPRPPPQQSARDPRRSAG